MKQRFPLARMFPLVVMHRVIECLEMSFNIITQYRGSVGIFNNRNYVLVQNSQT